MARAMVLVTAMVAASSTAKADPRVWLDDLLPLVDASAPLAMQPKSDHRIDMLAAATAQRHDRLWQAISITALTVSTATLACDWGETHRAASRGWMAPDGRPQIEGNRILGRRPTTRAVDAYFAATVALNIIVYMVLPKKYKAIISAAVALGESYQIYDNIGYVSTCGL